MSEKLAGTPPSSERKTASRASVPRTRFLHMERLHWKWVSLFLLMTLSCFVAFGLAFGGDFFHDEHQFVAAGELLAEHGLLPYKDFPYHHTPNLILLYALLFQFSAYSLLPARLFAAVSFLLSSLLLASTTWIVLGEERRRHTWPLAFAIAINFLLNPLTNYTASRAWNQDFPLMLSLFVTWSLLRGRDRALSTRSLLFGGLALGTAVGSRLSYATLFVPYFGYLLYLLRSAPMRTKVRRLLLGSSGIALGLTPLLMLTILAPAGSLFGNLTYPRLSHTYFQLVEHTAAMDFIGKASFALNITVQHPGLGILAVLLTFAWFRLLRGRNVQQRTDLSTAFFLISMLAAILAGSFAPTPSWFQYFYAAVPFTLLALAGAGQAFRSSDPRAGTAVLIGLIAALMINLLSSPFSKYIQALSRIRTSVPMQVHQLGESIHTLVPDGRVLTLAPIFPLESGLEIYPDFATGPFSWRVGDLLTREKRSRYSLISFHELEAVLEGDKPAGILTGFERENPGLTYLDKGGLERPFESYAEDNGYRPVILARFQDVLPILWLPE